jgi:hypothetical protein
MSSKSSSISSLHMNFTRERLSSPRQLMLLQQRERIKRKTLESGACITDNAPHNSINLMGHTLS